MLKIKDSVDLKELEKFGFKYSENIIETYDKEVIYYPLGDNTPCCQYFLTILKNNRHIYNNICGLKWEGKHENYKIEFLDTLYDLIKADLVEKVDD